MAEATGTHAVLSRGPGGAGQPSGATPASVRQPDPVARAEEALEGDLRALNRDVNVALLTSRRPRLAEALLREVALQPGARGGFVVRHVQPGSPSARLGLRPGDLLYTLDTAANTAVDEQSMVALTQQTTIEVEVWREGQWVTLVLNLNHD